MSDPPPASERRTIFFGRFISTPKPDELLIRTGAVLVSSADGRGTIEKADWTVNGPNDAASKLGVEAPVVCASDDGFFFPGFIDTHIHASQYGNAGIFGKSTLLDWLKTYTFPLESSLGNVKSPMYANVLTPPDPLARAKVMYDRAVSRTLSHGTTTASYFATLDVAATNALADICLDKGQRAFIGRVCMDDPRTSPDYYIDESLEDMIRKSSECVEHCRNIDAEGLFVQPIITPRFAPTCTMPALKMLGELANKEKLRIQTHISENQNEVKLVSELHPEQNSYAAVYDASGLLNERMILAHAVHLTDEEMTLVASRRAKIAHCPASNSALGSGFCPVRKLLDHGIEVGLGTDVSGGFSVSILEVVRQAYMVGRHIGFLNNGDSRHNLSVIEGLYLGTMGGAQVVGMEGKVGGFEEGMLWDVQEIQLGQVGDNEEQSSAVDIFGWESWEERVAKWVWNGSAPNVRKLWVGGKLVHQK